MKIIIGMCIWLVILGIYAIYEKLHEDKTPDDNVTYTYFYTQQKPKKVNYYRLNRNTIRFTRAVCHGIRRGLRTKPKSRAGYKKRL